MHACTHACSIGVIACFVTWQNMMRSVPQDYTVSLLAALAMESTTKQRRAERKSSFGSCTCLVTMLNCTSPSHDNTTLTCDLQENSYSVQLKFAKDAAVHLHVRVETKAPHCGTQEPMSAHARTRNRLGGSSRLQEWGNVDIHHSKQKPRTGHPHCQRVAERHLACLSRPEQSRSQREDWRQRQGPNPSYHHLLFLCLFLVRGDLPLNTNHQATYLRA